MTADRRGAAWRKTAVAVLALAAIVVSLVRLTAADDGLVVTQTALDGTPVTVHRLAGGAPGPAVVIAHGFAGSRPLMAPFAVTLARAGYVAVGFDFLGHGRNPNPLTGDVTAVEGATRALVAETQRVVAFARDRAGGDGRVALLGHSMASDIVVRAAAADPAVAATVAVSMYSEAVTATEPRNLLIIVGAWERFLAREALAAVALATGGPAAEGVTYGDPADGSARRAVLADRVEHVGVLYSRESLTEAVGWLDAVFDRARPPAVDPDRRGPWIGVLFAGIVALAWPLSSLLPGVDRAMTPPLARRRLLALAGLPALATPVLLWPLPTTFLPVLVADYLAVHLAVYGGLTALGLWVVARPAIGWPDGRLILSTLAATLFGVFAIALPLDAFVTSFLPHPGRVPVLVALGLGATAYTLADEWLVRRAGAPWWGYALTKLCFLVSLGIAVALDLEDLFFLLIVAPVLVVFFALYGTFSHWLYRATGHPTVAGIANGAAFAWALGVTFPMLAG